MRFGGELGTDRTAVGRSRLDAPEVAPTCHFNLPADAESQLFIVAPRDLSQFGAGVHQIGDLFGY